MPQSFKLLIFFFRNCTKGFALVGQCPGPTFRLNTSAAGIALVVLYKAKSLNVKMFLWLYFKEFTILFLMVDVLHVDSAIAGEMLLMTSSF